MKYICIIGANMGHNHDILYKISRDSKLYEINPYPGELPTSWIKW